VHAPQPVRAAAQFFPAHPWKLPQNGNGFCKTLHGLHYVRSSAWLSEESQPNIGQYCRITDV